MVYDNEQVMQAFKLFSTLSIKGYGLKEELHLYMADEIIRGLVDQFAKEEDCTVFTSGDYIYMIPVSKNSIYHVSNDYIKNKHLPAKAVNLDLYMMYVAVIVLFGEFYDSYQTMEATRDFLPVNEWLSSFSQRIMSLKEHGLEKLKELDKEYDYNWSAVIDKWEDMDEIKENVKSQDARTNSRKSFINIVKQFLVSQELIKDIGNEELELTEKAKIIIQRYYMEYDYNRGILDFMYSFDKKKGEV